MLSLLLSLAFAGSSYDMNDVGVVIDLPGWESLRWSDESFRGTNKAGPMAIEVWYTPWQLPVDKETAKDLGVVYRSRLESVEHANNARVEDMAVEEVGGRPTALSTLRFNFDRVGAKGILEGASFAGDGRMVHLIVYGPLEAAGKIRAARQQILESLKQNKPAAALDTNPLKAPFGAISLPSGWRAPLPSENVEELSKTTGEADPSKCVSIVRPHAVLKPDLLLLCPRDWHFGVLDKDSFPELEPQFRAKLYGKAAEKVEAGRLLTLADRSAVTYAPRMADYDLRVTLLPYENKVLQISALGVTGQAEELETAVNTTLSSVAWSGADGGKPAYTTGETLVHGVKYNPFHPLKLLCIAIGLGGVGLLARRVLGREQNENPGGY